MIRKLLVVAAAIAMPVSVVAVGGGIASASNPHTAATDTITCKTLTGTLSFSPKIDRQGLHLGHRQDDGLSHGVGVHGVGLDHRRRSAKA